jgi:hypothetical protein
MLGVACRGSFYLLNQNLCASKSIYILIVKIMCVNIYSHLSKSINYFFYLVSYVTSIWLIASLLYCHLDFVVDFLVEFVCSLRLLIFFCLEYFICHIALMCSFSNNFVYSLATWVRILSYCYHPSHLHIISFHYMSGNALSYFTTCHLQ